MPVGHGLKLGGFRWLNLQIQENIYIGRSDLFGFIA